jgi:hypothetical protein
MPYVINYIGTLGENNECGSAVLPQHADFIHPEK